MQFRIGLNLGEVIVDRGEVYGNGVNVAARLETLAEPAGICISGAARDAIGNKLALSYEYLGEHQVKNIEEPVRAYRVNFSGEPDMRNKVAAPPSRGRKLWPVAVAAALAPIALGAWFVLSRSAPTLSSPTVASAPAPVKANRIAVLPFANLSANPDNEYFSDGMTEEMISKLSRVPGLEVIARTSVIVYKGSNKKIAEIAKELNVSSVLEGSVRRNGDKLRITAQLINAANKAHLWSNDYDRDLRDVFAIQSDVARNVAEALRVTLSPTLAQQIEKKGTENLQAYDLYLQGIYHQSKGTADGLQASIELFSRAIEKDPRFARAYAVLALTFELQGIFGLVPQRIAFSKQAETARRSLALDDMIADAHNEIASAKLYLELDWVGAEKSLNRALELNPNLSGVYEGRALNLFCPLGRHDEALASERRAMDLDPHSSLTQGNLGWIYWCARRHDQAIEQFKIAIAREPTFNFNYWGIGLSYAAVGRFEDSIKSMQKYVEFSGGGGDSLGGLGWAYGMAGRRDEALAVLAKLKDLEKKGNVEKIAFALVHTGLGNKDAAFEWLEKVYADGNYQRLLYLNGGNWVDPLRADQRFAVFVKKLGLTK